MSEERELLKRAIMALASEYPTDLIDDIEELLEKPEGLTPRQGLAEYKKGYMIGYDVAVRDLKQKVDSVFNLIMEEDDESDT